MLKKKYRLKKFSAFIATYKNNNTVSDNKICIYYGKKKQFADSNTKFAFVVSKKIHKRAVVRNRIKRLMREHIRKIIDNPEYKFLHNYISIIFVAKKEAVNAKYNDISNSLDSLLTSKTI